MDADLRSRKRKQPSPQSTPFMGVCTRSKSKLNPLILHNNPVHDKNTPAKSHKDCIVRCTHLITFDDEPATNGNPNQTEAFDTKEIQFVGPRKGILKNNSGDCRGLCRCPKCASFRFDAYRAIKFAKKLSRCAEKIALDLIKPFTHLRDVVEESALLQAKAACQKALIAEELAMNRLSQMKADLIIHGRNTAPRVTFANIVEENVIPKVDLPRRLSRLKLRRELA